jgi:hypothetical protein
MKLLIEKNLSINSYLIVVVLFQRKEIINTFKKYKKL